MYFYDKKSDQGFTFEIPEQYKKLILNCSGGADSSMLLFLTATYLKEQGRENDVSISALTCSEEFNGRWNGRYATNVIEYVIEKTKFTNFDVHYTYYRNEKTIDEFHFVEKKHLVRGDADLFVGGLTSNPPKESYAENIHGKMVSLWDDRMLDRDDRTNDVFHYDTFYSPFRNVDKRMIAYLYDYFEIPDLLDITRSCEATPDTDADYLTFSSAPCGECWWCLERKWAFGKF